MPESIPSQELDLDRLSVLLEDSDLLEVERVKQKAVRQREKKAWPVNELDDLVEYTQLPVALVARNMVRGADMVASRWMRENPRSKEEIALFYQHCSEYVYLSAYHSMMLKTYRKLLRIFKNESGGNCLNFGGGCGTEALKLAMQQNEVWYCDVPGSPVWRFAKWRAEKTSARIHFVDRLPDEVAFDCVVAFNVFQILTADQLQDLLPRIAAVMKPGARLYCQNNFDSLKGENPKYRGEGFCWQGRVAQHYDHTELWRSLVVKLGLEKVTEQIYRKENISS